MVRRTLAGCSAMLTWASDHGGPQARPPMAVMTGQLASGRSPSGVIYDINLAIDYLDFARPPGAGRDGRLYRLVDAAYERRSVAVSSNLQLGSTSSCPRHWPPPPSIA